MPRSPIFKRIRKMNVVRRNIVDESIDYDISHSHEKALARIAPVIDDESDAEVFKKKNLELLLSKMTDSNHFLKIGKDGFTLVAVSIEKVPNHKLRRHIIAYELAAEASKRQLEEHLVANTAKALLQYVPIRDASRETKEAVLRKALEDLQGPVVPAVAIASVTTSETTNQQTTPKLKVA